MLQLVVFDWNGTLMDDLKVNHGSVEAICKHWGVTPPTLNEFLATTTANVPDFLRKLGLPEYVRNEEVAEVRIEHFQKHWDDAELRRDVKETLELCHRFGLRIAIVSAERRPIIKRRCEELNLTSYFEIVKADAFDKVGAFYDVFTHTGCQAQRAIYVDDSPDGIRSAQRAGLRTIGFTGGYHSRERILSAKPDFPNERFLHADDFKAVAKIIEHCANGGW